MVVDATNRPSTFDCVVAHLIDDMAVSEPFRIVVAEKFGRRNLPASWLFASICIGGVGFVGVRAWATRGFRRGS